MVEGIVSLVLDKLSDAFEKDLPGDFGKQVGKLSRELSRIKDFLKDADMKQIVNKREEHWVKEVRDVAYDIEDMIDNALLLKVSETGNPWKEHPAGSSQKAPGRVIDNALLLKFPQIGNPSKEHLAGFAQKDPERVGMKRKRYPSLHTHSALKQILARIRQINESRVKYGINSLGEGSGERLRLPIRPPVLHESDDPDVISFDSDRDNIIKMLLDSTTKRRAVISIVGPGGLGKTSLARKVYNSNDAKKWFDVRIWVTISLEFNLIDILRKIIEQVEALTRNDLEGGEEYLLTKLHKTLNGEKYTIEDHLRPHSHKPLNNEKDSQTLPKKYLLVLDGMWRNDLWTQIGGVLPDAKIGSRVIVTTRIQNIVDDAEPYRLPYLTEKPSLELLLKKALPNPDLSKGYFDELYEVGKQFVKKCGGLPLALLVIGGMLSKKPANYAAWSKMLQSMNWGIDGRNCAEIMANSYDDLPFVLKSCFMYFAAFPEDHEIDAQILIRLWVAEGLIPVEKCRTLEDTAESFLEDLVQRSLVQVSKRSPASSITRCRIHYILRELAIQKSMEDNFLTICSNPDSWKSSAKTRRVAVHYSGCDELIEHANPNLRSLLCFGQHRMPNCSRQRLLKVVSDMRQQWGELDYEYFHGLNQLRYCKLTGRLSSNRRSSFESFIGGLKFVVTLDFREVNLDDLPNDVWNVNTLRHVMLKEYTSGPSPSADLRNLQTLTGVRSIESWDALSLWKSRSQRKARSQRKDRLPKLPNLRDLDILVESSFSWDLIAKLLGTLNHLTFLKLLGSEVPQKIVEMHRFPFFQHLESLSLIEMSSPPNNKLSLEVGMFPIYVKKLTLIDLQFKEDLLLVLEKLCSLKVLDLQGVQSNRKMSCSDGGFQQLHELKLYNLTNLEEWEIKAGAMPVLKVVELFDCNKLRVPLGLQYLSNLKELWVLDCSELNKHADEIRDDICKHVPQVEAHKRKQKEVGDQVTQLFNINKGFPHLSFEPSTFHPEGIATRPKYIVPFHDMVNQMNKIRHQSDEIADRQIFQLRSPMDHKVDKASFFGRDAEKMKVIDYLLSKKEISFSVISIVGKGGLGKTTIAQLVYKDLRTSRCFDLFGWVCISEGFDVRRLIKATVESITKVDYGVSELNPLQEELAKIVKEKSLLLILDDVWNEDQSLWQLFRVPFKEAKMVRILVTTRNKKVAEVMQTTACFSLTNLPEHSCWQLFQHYALNGTCHLMPTRLVDMGRAIMRKCGGLPLGVKLIASLLRHETYEQGWREILESDLWESNASDDIFPALQISYARLPAHLRPCFLFCSMYPKHYILKKMNLIDLWISHGYIESKGERKITEIGVEYYEELKERSFLDDFSNCISEYWELQQRYFLDDSSSRFSECCKLNDIIHDFARYNSKKEHYLVETNQLLDIQKGNFSIETHHLYAGGFMGYVNQILQQNQQNLKGLRTLSIDLRGCSGDLEHQYCVNNAEAVDLNSKLSEHYEECSGEVTICNLIKFEALMVLELKGYNLAKIPDSISMLKQLVHLTITSSRLKILPSSIGLLHNLQTLILDCFSLEYLPECIGNLAKLQFLHIQSGTIKKLPESLCSLSNLLRLVIISNDLEEVPLDIENLRNLHALTICSNQIQALPNTVGCLRSLEELNLLSLGGSHDDLPDGKLEYVPHVFVNFPAIKTMAAWLGVRTINWLKDMKDLEGKLSIGGLKNTSNLEDAQHANLRNKCKLETLDLCWDPGYYISPYDVKSELRLSLIPEACEGSLVGANDVAFSLLECLQPHPNLKKLLVRWYPSGRIPNWMRDPSSFRSIQEVLLECCVNIQSLPFHNFHSLKHLTIVACPSIQVLQLELVSNQLEKLQIVSCDHLELITGLGNLDMLAALEIYSCQALKSLTMGGMQLVLSTETFGDSSHGKPHTGQQSIASLRRLEIENCYLLHFMTDGLIPPGPCYVRVCGCGCPDMERNLTSAINEISCSSNLWRWR